MSTILLDEHSHPPLRVLIGALLERATTADFAISRLRLDGLDLRGAELERLQRCRVLLGRLDANTIEEMIGGGRGSARQHHLRALGEFLGSGRVEVRAAGVVAWNPDFSVLGQLTGAPAPAVALVGAHYFLRPYPIDGVALTSLYTEPAAIARIQSRFDEIWELGYDVGEVVRASVAQLNAEVGEGSSVEAHAGVP